MEEDEYRPSFARWLFLHVLPAGLLLLLGSALIFVIAFQLKKEPETRETPKILPSVEVLEVQPEPKRVIVKSQGTVEARTHTTLLAEVSGRVESISPSLYAGGFFAKGEVLAKVEDIDYQANLASAKSRYAEAKLAYEQELALSEQAQEDWKGLGNSGSASELVLRKPQLERATANLEAAEAGVTSAERDLQRTEIKAPYQGRVQRKYIDLGQYVSARQSQIADIYSVDTAEIRLGIPLGDTGLINLQEKFVDGATNGTRPTVTITANYGGVDYHWQGSIDRSEGAVDPQTRLLYLVAQVDNPYSQTDNPGRPPLKVGSFVQAEIEGVLLENAFVIPRRALRENNSLYVVGDDGKLEIREIVPYQKTKEEVIVQGQLEAGELICLTPLQYVVNGMEVAISGDEDRTIEDSPDTVTE